MKIVELLGQSNSGKTTTLNLVYSTIGKNAPRKTIPCGSPDDFETIFTYNNKKVAIFSLGDTQCRVLKAIDNYANQNIDVLIIAYNKRFTKSISSLRPQYQVTIINKTFNEQNISTVNQRDCTTVIANI